MQKQVIIAFVLLAAVIIGVRTSKNVGFQSASMVPTPSTSTEMVQVQSGQRSTCTECGKIITAHTHIETRTVPASEASKYGVMDIGEKCSECQAKEAGQQNQNSGSQVTGKWIFRIAFGDSVVTVNADGTGSISDYPTTTFTWHSTGDDSFSATVAKSMSSRKDFSAQVVSEGRQLLITGWSPASGYFGTDKNTLVDRIK